MTTNQARDNLLEAIPLTTDIVREIKNLAQEANDARKLDADTYSKCPRCYGHHSIHGNFDNLCDQCQQTILQHFPDHESVPHIKAALAKWSNNVLGDTAAK
jgi:hypothetical protein